MPLDGNTRKALNMWQSGRTLEEIGRALNTSAKQAGLTILERRQKKDARAARRTNRNSGTHYVPNQPHFDADERLLGKLWHEQAMKSSADGVGIGVPLMDLERGKCRWPISQDEDGQHLFCGHDIHRPDWARFTHHYCEHHANRAARPGNDIDEYTVRRAVRSGRQS
jgi:hypothetical protein